MRSVADSLREDTRRRVAGMSAQARIELALELGDADIASLCAFKDIEPAEARAIIARSRAVGRQPSVANRA